MSTRGQAPVLSFEEAMLTGLARDGGLYLPETIPVLSHDEIAALEGVSYEEAAFRIMKPYIGDTFTDDEFRAIIARAYDGVRPCRACAPWCNWIAVISCWSCSTGRRSRSRISRCSLSGSCSRLR